ncbi:MAG TPA: mevalonate kinase [Chloroflexi bacterium]|nr:mevalonate kinase [Chloroflexota bacterium]
MRSEQVRASAPGKIILFGEHAVVYGRPAIAAPVTQVQATATVQPAPPGAGFTIAAPDIGQVFSFATKTSTAAPDDPLAVAVQLVLADLSVEAPDATLTIRSTIPIASGLGSGAAVATALVRALAAYLGRPLAPDQISALVYQVEKLHHGTPSGIDNTVIAYEQPIYFVRKPAKDPAGFPVGLIERLIVGAPLILVIGDTGLPSPTKQIVAQVRRTRERDPARCDARLDQIGDVAVSARHAIEAGDVDTLGPLMDENHALLIELGVSSPKLNAVVEAARIAGAIGAKLSGAGHGGNMIALVQRQKDAADVIEALKETGAKNVICTTIQSTLPQVQK